MIRSFLAALFLCLATLPASAAEPNIAGHWTFVAQIQSDCTFTGTARLVQEDEDRYSGELTAHQSCPTLPEDFLVRQTCKATRLGSQLSVRCQIVEFVNGFDSAYYYPDNFTLTIESADRMYGALVSSTFTPSPAEWIRSSGGIS